MTAEEVARRRRFSPKREVESGKANSPLKPRPRPKKKKRRKVQPNDVPFWLLFLQVGSVLFVLCAITYGSYRYFNPYIEPDAADTDEMYDDGVEGEELPEEKAPEPTKAPSPATAPPIPVFDLPPKAKMDAFGIISSHSNLDDTKFWEVAKELRETFSERYGGENSARAMLQRGLQTFGTPESTACRLRQAVGTHFRFAFGGYSVTAGRGNYFSQSFPFVMERLLKEPMRLLNINLEVRNAAIGGVPSFPYGWCLENFWGTDADVVSWDYSMNEAGGIPQGLEAYLRQTRRLERNPKLIVKDTHLAQERRAMVGKYADSLVDPIILMSDPAVEPFFGIEDRFRPPGFQQWRAFGAPPGSPGQAAHHPSKKEHEMLGWMLAMHFLASLELLALGVPLKCPQPKDLPPNPVSTNETTSLLFGTKNAIQCRTTFHPIVQGDFSEIVVNGTIDTGDLLMPKGAMYYQKGWVMDLSEGERTAKRKLDRFGGLGFLDSKQAFYGIFSSGPLELFLPVSAKSGTPVVKVVANIVVCQVNEKYRDPDACRGDQHILYKIDGINATDPKYIDSPGTLYLGHKLCINVTIPEDSKVSTFKGETGVHLTVRVKDKHIMKKDLACSICHVVWEEFR